MNEAQRQFAMGVAGVRLWYARESLPGAAPSPDFDFGEPEAPEPAADAAAVTVPSARPSLPVSEASRKGLARLQGLLADTGAHTVPEAREGIGHGAGEDRGAGDVPATPESPQNGPEAIPEPGQVAVEPIGDALAGIAIGFQWRFWIGEQWLLVSSCPDTASRGLEDRLAGNILHALGDGVTSTEAVRWPVFSNPAVPGNDAAGAVEVVSAMAEIVTRPRQLWLGLAPDEPEPRIAELWRNVTAPLGEATVSFPGTLVALSSDPGMKRALWQALQQAGLS